MYNNVSKVIQEFIFNNEDICDDAHHIWVALKDMYTSADDDDDEDEEEECSTSTSCISPSKTSSTKQKSSNIATTASDQANSVASSSELGGTGFGSEQHQLASLDFRATSHNNNEVSTAPSTSSLLPPVCEFRSFWARPRLRKTSRSAHARGGLDFFALA
jgi:hypothetical protein